MVGRLGLLLDLVGEAAAADRLVLLEDGAEVRSGACGIPRRPRPFPARPSRGRSGRPGRRDASGFRSRVLLTDRGVTAPRGAARPAEPRVEYQPAGTISEGRLKRFMATSIPSRDEGLDRLAGGSDGRVRSRALGLREAVQDVVGQVLAGTEMLAGDADPEPREVVDAEAVDDALEPLLTSRRAGAGESARGPRGERRRRRRRASAPAGWRA